MGVLYPTMDGLFMFILENTTKMNDLGVPLFQENHHLGFRENCPCNFETTCLMISASDGVVNTEFPRCFTPKVPG